MKKIITFTLTLCIMLLSTVNVFAADTDRIDAQIEGAVVFLTNGVTSYGVDDAFDFYTLARSGVELGALADSFVADVKANLDANSGKIVSSYGESLATYGSVIMSLGELYLDPTDFYGYNIVDAFTKLDPATPQANCYFYRTIIPATLYSDNEAFGKAVCDTFVNTCYTMGKGMASYGYYGCDSTAMFIDAISSYAGEYEEIVDDAFTVLESYKVDGGYVYDTIYGTDPNADSTALVLMAYSSMFPYISDDERDDYYAKLEGIYNDLCTFEREHTGVFIGSYTLEEDYFATKDALMALEEYSFVAAFSEATEDEGSDEDYFDDNDITDDDFIGEITDDIDTINKAPSLTSPDTGVSLTAASCVIAFAIATAVTKKAKQK